MICPALFFFLKIVLAIQGLLWVHTNFRIFIGLSSVKIVMDILIWVALNLYIVLGGMPF